MKSKTTIQLPSDDIEWFRRAYSGASLSWILSLLLHSFRSIHDDTGVLPNKVSRDAAKETKEMIDEGIFDIKRDSDSE